MVECQLPKLKVASSSLVARFYSSGLKGDTKMYKRALTKIGIVAVAAFAVGCTETGNSDTANMNAANMNMTAMNSSMNQNAAMMSGGAMQPRIAPDNSEITVVNEGGETREVRRFRDPASRIERVEVVTRGNTRMARVYSRDNTVRDLPENRVEEALSATGNALADAGGYVADKTRQAAGATADAAGEVRDASGRIIEGAADKTREVGGRAVEAGREGGSRVVDGAKKVGEGAAKGAKKTGSAIKDAVTP